MSLTKEQADFLRSLGDFLSLEERARELFPEAFEPERINLLAANDGNQIFMSKILLKAGLYESDIQITTNSHCGLCGIGDSFYISPTLDAELKRVDNQPFGVYHLLILKRAKK